MACLILTRNIADDAQERDFLAVMRLTLAETTGLDTPPPTPRSGRDAPSDTAQMQRIFRNFIDELEAGDGAASLQGAMVRVASALGVQCFAYLQTPRDGRQAAG